MRLRHAPIRCDTPQTLRGLTQRHATATLPLIHRPSMSLGHRSSIRRSATSKPSSQAASSQPSADPHPAASAASTRWQRARSRHRIRPHDRALPAGRAWLALFHCGYAPLRPAQTDELSVRRRRWPYRNRVVVQRGQHRALVTRGEPPFDTGWSNVVRLRRGTGELRGGAGPVRAGHRPPARHQPLCRISHCCRARHSGGPKHTGAHAHLGDPDVSAGSAPAGPPLAPCEPHARIMAAAPDIPAVRPL